MSYDPETRGLLRAVLDDVCADVPLADSETRARVASSILQGASTGERSEVALKRIGQRALRQAA
jgi:hypothetical protein